MNAYYLQYIILFMYGVRLLSTIVMALSIVRPQRRFILDSPLLATILYIRRRDHALAHSSPVMRLLQGRIYVESPGSRDPDGFVRIYYTYNFPTVMTPRKKKMTLVAQQE